MAKLAKPAEPTLEKRLLWSGVIIAVALGLRLIFLFQGSDDLIFGYLSFDRLYYQQVAQQFLSGVGFEYELLFKPQLYPFILGLIYKFLGQDIFLALLIQAFLGAISCALIFLVALRFYPFKIAVTAGLIAAIYGTMIYYTAELLPVTLIIFLNMAVIFLLLRYDETRNFWYTFTAGIVLGLSAIAEPSALLFFVAILIWVFRRPSKRRVFRAREGGLLLAGLLLVLTPFWLRALSAGSEEVPFATHVGVTLAMGNNIEATGNTMDLPRSIAMDGFDYKEFVELSQRANLGERSLDQLGSLWFNRSVDFITADPGRWLLLELRKIGYMLMGYENWRHKPLYFFASETTPTNFLLWDKIVSFPFGIILPLALVALFARKMSRQRQGLLIGYVVVGAIVLLLTYVLEGQRLIFLPVIIVWAASGLWGLIERYQTKDFKQFYKLLAIFAAVLVICNGLTALPGLTPRVNDVVEGEVYTANALILLEQYSEARLRLERALRLNPRSADAHLAMGSIYSQSGQYELAAQAYRRVSSLDPSNSIAQEALAKLLQRSEQLEELNHFIAGIVRSQPKANWAHEFYARMHMRLGEFLQAADIMERAYQVDSTYFDAIFVKADAFLKGDMRVDAERELKRYLEFMPSSIEAHANLGQVYARQHRFEEALTQFSAARAAQPWNPASYFNLATLGFQMGDLRRADAYLDTVLIYDPTFPGVDIMRFKIDSTATVLQQQNQP